MLSADETQTYLTGTWQLMMGKPEGLRQLDLSADGFWNSFFALIVAAPALIVGWVSVANEIGDPNAFAGRLGMLVRLAMVDIGGWVLPLVALAVAAPYVGMGDRFVHYVVASNWASAIVAWLVLPAALVGLFLPATNELANVVTLFFFLLSMYLTWRMTNAVIGKGPALGSAIFTGMFIISVIVLFSLQALLGITVME